ncbi:helicase-exonuclease AddAB subunit AddB [Paenibacillus paeoniae]|uniref:ATP-dependent helicase/deoxyribonuclease subunit B n=1 Tax=Paenibacillus paeoniae TaxID=2292705 RepID=A0A371PN96_9BACL|nr:helicase-exonuclease AddAB subunit AddB [Paenibacillus paeoniae]REK77415.1 helicase-exonuclease AddAB subunit AddB [Paenibacillus paeoniae]
MPLRLIIGRAGSGKTTYCQDEIRKQLQREPDGPPLIMLVPEQATFQSEYTLLHRGELRGSLRAQALSFRRLAFRVMQETGGTALVPIGDTGKSMLLYKIVHRLSSRLALFQSGAEQAGFIERLSELLTEWKRYGVNAEGLRKLDARLNSGERLEGLLDRKLHDLSLIYEEMESSLAGQYIDAEDYLDFLKSSYSAAPSMQDAQIWVDGFHGFTPTEYEALGSIMKEAKQVNITLTLDRFYASGDRPHELELFHPTAETCIRLSELAEAHGIEVLPTLNLNAVAEFPHRFSASPMLEHLEKHYDKRVPMLLGSRNEAMSHGIRLQSASGRRAEVEAVARDIRARARNGGLRWRDIAILTRNTEDYADYLSLILDDYGIPHFVDQKEKALHHPLVEFIRSALETILNGWHYDAVFRCIKTEMLFPMDGSLPRDWFDRLENYALAAGIDGWKWLDRRSWRPIAPLSLEEDDTMETVISAKAQREFDIAMAAREAVVPLLKKFEDAIGKASNIREMCEALYKLLDHSDAADRLERWSREDMERGEAQRGRAHRQLWDSVMSLLDQLVELAGDEFVSPELFAGIVESGLEGLKLAAVPPALDQVLVGSMDRTRSGRIRACYVLGANDGIMPMRVKEDGILTEAERDTLVAEGVEMAPSVRRRLLDERFMIYNALTTPSDLLWISWAEADEEGKSLLPSEIIRSIRGLFPGLPTYESGAEPSESMSVDAQREYAQHPDRTLTHLIAALRRWQQGSPIAPFWWDMYNWYVARPEWQSKLQLLTGSLTYHNRESRLPMSLARELYGERMTVSVSRMERFVSCPFQHFAIHGLKLRERKLYRLEAPDVGQLFHAALSKLAGSLSGRWGKLTREEVKEEASKTVDEIAPKLQSQILLSSGRFQFIARKLKEIVAQAAVILGEHAKRAHFQPLATELDFGPGGTLPALVLPLPSGGEMEVVGRIDRVDAAKTEEGLLLRVLDYKSSATSLKLEEVVHGLSLQMLTYLDVLITHSEGWLGEAASPAGVLYFHVHNPLLALSNGLSAEEVSDKLLKRYKTRGLLTADAEVTRLMDGELDTGHSDLLPVALKRDGSFYSSSSVVTSDQWTTLRRSVRGMISRIGGTIMEGEVSIEPYRLGAKSPCQFCDYKAVCQFDPLFEGNEYKKLTKSSKEDAWRQLEGV